MRGEAVFVALVLALGATGCGDDGGGAPSGEVRVVGDSLAFGASRQIEDAIEARLENWETHVDGINSATIRERLPAVKRAVDEEPDVLVIVLGTNDTFERPRDLENRVLDVMNATQRVPCVLWVTIPAPDPLATALNVLLLLHGFDKEVRVIDWAKLSHGHDEWFVGDAVHNTPAGKRALGAAIADEVAKCARPANPKE